MSKYEQGGNWLSDQRKECTKCVAFINEVYGLVPQLSEDDLGGSDLVYVGWYIYLLWDDTDKYCLLLPKM